MRPLELSMEGSRASASGRTWTSGALEFAISGATGTGKSSILDAITFALFGRVVRVGKSCQSLVSLGRDAMSVKLKFRSGGRVYEVARRLRRGAATTAVLEDETGNLASRVRDVDARVESLLGMPFETFTQAVVLPQGQFAKFLGSSGAARTEILRHLLGLEIYDRMRKRAEEKRRDADQRVRVLEDQRAKHFAHASPERLAELERLEMLDGERIGVLSHDAEERAAALAEAVRDHERTRDLAVAEREIDALVAREPELEEARAPRRRGAAEPHRGAIASSTSARGRSPLAPSRTRGSRRRSLPRAGARARDARRARRDRARGRHLEARAARGLDLLPRSRPVHRRGPSPPPRGAPRGAASAPRARAA
ncbi:MAG: SMC family ATPase [Polyangiaceae bacterium]